MTIPELRQVAEGTQLEFQSGTWNHALQKLEFPDDDWEPVTFQRMTKARKGFFPRAVIIRAGCTYPKDVLPACLRMIEPKTESGGRFL